MKILSIKELCGVPDVPISRPFIERLIGTVRREYLDHVLFWNENDLKHKIAKFQTYYNQARVHYSLNGKTPVNCPLLMDKKA